MNRGDFQIVLILSLALTLALTLGLTCFIFCNPASAARQLTLSEAIQLAVENDPETKNAKRSIHIGQTRRSQAKLRYYPKMEFGLTNSPQVDYYGQPAINNMLMNTYVGLEQPLYAGGVIKNSVKMAESEIRRQKSEFSFYQHRIATEATKAYYQALSTQGTVGQYEALVRQGEEDLREVQTREAAGISSRMELLEVSTRILDAQQKLSKARAEHQTAITGLKKVLGLEGEEGLRLSDEMPIGDVQDDYQTLLGEASSKRPELLYLAEDVTYNQLKTDVEKGKQRPQLSLVAYHEWQSPQVFESNKNFGIFLKASFSWENTTLSFQETRNQIYPNAYAYPRYPGAPPLQTYYFPVRTLKYSVFDNSSNKVELEKARSDRDLARDRWVREEQNLAAELKSTLVQKRESASRIGLAKNQVSMSEELVEVSRSKYRTGLATLADVLKARAALAEARINMINAQKDLAVSLAQLHMILGRSLVGREAGL